MSENNLFTNVYAPARQHGATDFVITRCGMASSDEIGIIFWLAVFGAPEEYYCTYNKLRHIGAHTKSWRIRKKAAKRRRELVHKAKRRCLIIKSE